MDKIKEIVKQMTLEEKAGMCSGADFWNTKAVERLKVPAMMVSDGPHGLRKQATEGDHLGLMDSIEAVCFPAACATACTFDRDLMTQMGQVLGNECQAENVGVLLGPAVNIKRSPLCGRNFEYLSEDPYLTGELATAYIQGVQSQNVGTSIKHFAANNQEHERMSGDSQVDERTLREIYLPGFETPVKEAQPWSVMCAYNKVNGTFASENKTLLTDILREEWGFEGFVVSDWGAVSKRVAGVIAGLDLEMPSSNGVNDQLLVQAVRDGKMAEAVLDQAAERILNIVYRYCENRQEKAVFDRPADHAKAVEIAKQCMVLLKNEDILPLTKGQEGIAFIGGFAETPRFQGGGSSHINAHRVPSAVELAKEYGTVAYAKGFSAKEDKLEQELIDEAVEVAAKAGKVVIFAGLPDVFESEGYDRSHMRLPECQNKLIEAVCQVQKNVIVVLHNGSPVEMPWAADVQGILEAYLCGEGTAEALLAILYGEANPSGKLAESFPLRLEDNPSYLQFPGKNKIVQYTEGIFVGYRYYDAKKIDVLFPFGHGLSYTSYEYSNLKLSAAEIKDTDELTVSVDITNTGKMAGKEIVQLYVSDRTESTIRPMKELKNFAAVTLQPGETGTVTMKLSKRAFAWYHVQLGDWYAASGEYRILIGRSSQDIVLEESVRVNSTTELKETYDQDTTIGELVASERTKEFVAQQILSHAKMFAGEGGGGEMDEMMAAMMKYMPLRALKSFGGLTEESMNQMLAALNSL